MKYRIEVEYDDDGAAWSGASYGRTRRCEIISITTKENQTPRDAVKELFSSEGRLYQTVRRIGTIEAVKEQ